MKLENPVSRKALLFSAFLVLLTAFSTAQTVDLESGSNEFWLNSDAVDDGNVEISFEAKCDNYDIGGPGRAASHFDYNPQEDKAVASLDADGNYDPSFFGEYSVEVSCSEQNATGAFTLKRLQTVLNVSGNKDVFRGDSLNLNADVRVLGGRAVPDYRIYLRSSQKIHDLGENKNSVTVPETVEPGPAALEIRSSVEDSDGNEFEESTLVEGLKIKNPWSIEVSNETLNPSLISYEDLGRFQRNVRISFKNSPVNYLTSNSFFLTVENGNGSVVSGLDKKKGFIRSKMLTTNGKYSLRFKSIPQLSVGKYTFKIGLDHEKGEVILDKFQVDNYVRFNGVVVNSAGKAVNTGFQAVRDRTSPGIRSSNGEYSASLLPGRYNMTVRFPEVTMDFRNVRIDRETVDFRADNQPIRYDDLTASQLKGTVQGATVLNAVAVDFAIPFEDAQAVMNYDSSRAAFNEVEVMQCSQWVGGSCSTEWKLTDRNMTEVDLGQVSFPVHASSVNGEKILRNAFMVIKNTDLVPKELKLGSKRVPRGETLPFSGKIVSSAGTPIANADVNITVRQGNNYVKSQVVQTSGNGRFQASMRVPEKSGTYSISLKGSKKPFNSFTSKDVASFTVYIPRELSVSTPDSAEFYLGETARLSFDVINSGAAEVKDVKLRVKGLKNTWYEFQQQKWNSLQPGDRREAVMRVDLPADYCKSECKKYPKFNVEVIGTSGGQSLQTVKTIQAVVTKKNKTQVSGNQSSGGGLNFDSPEVISATGKFLASQSSLNLALSLVMVFMLVLAGAVKHKQGSGDRSGRGGRNIGGGRSGRGSGRPNVQRPDVTSSEEESEGGQSSEELGSDSSEDTGEDEDVLKCGKCGEEFDTESALKIHKQAIH